MPYPDFNRFFLSDQITPTAARSSLHFMLGKLYKLLLLRKPLRHPPKKSLAKRKEGFKSAGMFLENRRDIGHKYGLVVLRVL